MNKEQNLNEPQNQQLNIAGVSIRTCYSCGNRNGGINYGVCMLSGYYCMTERKIPSVCGKNFENWTPRPKRKGLKQWLQSLWYDC